MNYFIYFLTILISALFISMLEINIEGKSGWASSLPTWKSKVKILGKRITGYHLFLMLSILSLSHAPLFIFNIWTFQSELLLISFFIFTMLVEDFLWFILNPAYGLKRFNKNHVDWHKIWILGLPIEYHLGMILGLLTLYASQS